MDRKIVFSNLIWRFMERTGAKLVAFVVSVILARLLAPEVYGSIALVMVFITILQIFVDSGFANALIQKKDADDTDFSTVFYFNIALCLTLYVILFFVSPLIARFYKDDTLAPVIRVLGLTVVISGVKNVQQAYVSRTLQFKRFFFATLGGTIGAAIVGIVMAYMGLGVWALVGQQIFNTTVDTLILWITVKWRPKKLFSLQRLKGLFGFGWKLLLSSFIDTAYQNLRQLLIGRIYTKADLAQYNRGLQFPDFVITNVNSSIDSVLLPVLSQAQDSPEQVKMMTRRAMKTSTFVVAPLMMGLAFVGTPMVRLLLTEKWLPCVPYMVIFCIIYLFYPMNTANLNALKAMGRSDIYLKLEIIKKVIGLTVLICTVRLGVMVMAYSSLFTTLCSILLNAGPNKKLLNYGYFEQFKDIIPYIGLSVFMGVCIYPIQWIGLPDVVTLIIQVPLGALIYVLGAKLFKFDSMNYLLSIVKRFITEKSKK